MKKSAPPTDSIERLMTSVSQLTFVGTEKGGVGKSFIAALVTDLMDVYGQRALVVQVDEQNRLPSLYPDRVTSVMPATMEDLRRDPAAIIEAFDPLYSAVEKTIADRVPTVFDFGGPQQAAAEEYFALIDLNEDLLGADVTGNWLIPTTAEPEAMRSAIKTANAIGRILPSIRRVLVLNHRDGPFRFYPGSPADKIWRTELEPLCTKLGAVKLPAINAGSWAPFETAGKRFVDVIGGDIPQIREWTGRSHPASKVIRGDVASFVAAADAVLSPLLGLGAE
jgi:hypothetical protein